MYKIRLLIFFVFFFELLNTKLSAQLIQNGLKPNFNYGKISFVDLDKDGDPDILRSFINKNIPIQFIDDDDDMTYKDFEGDTDNDCLMIDRNIDGKYGFHEDLIVDWVDTNGDNLPDLQIIVDNAKLTDKGWTPGHFMICIDTDKDGVFNFINWNTLQVEPWEKWGRSHFWQDYLGNSILLKTHTSSFNMNNTTLNWENPFLFFDEDNDGLTEMAIRFMDQPEILSSALYPVQLTGQITDIRYTFDLDNDNHSSNPFDFDLSIKLQGKGFNYSNYKQYFTNLSGLPAADTFFLDSRWRRMKYLTYIPHKLAYNKIFDVNNWAKASLVFDEDDDCERWERVEFYEPKKLFAIGAGNNGLDNNPQADVAGDRGEWDEDFSGKGALYIGKFDGKIHLFGAETGAWRVDFNAKYYQGWQGWRNGGDSIPHDEIDYEPTIFSTIKYTDTDNNGFFDLLQFDIDGDRIFEDSISLLKLNILDSVTTFSPKNKTYKNYEQLFLKALKNADNNIEYAKKTAILLNIKLGWYQQLLNKSTSKHLKYQNNFWFNWFFYRHLIDLKNTNKLPNTFTINNIQSAFANGNWKLLLNGVKK